MSRAIEGDYVIPCGLRTLDSTEMLRYSFVDNICSFELYQLNNSFDYILGYFNECDFIKVAKIYFNKINDLYEVDTIYVANDRRKSGLASEIYKYFVKVLGFKILSANLQRFGARRLWSKLSKDSELAVDIVAIDYDENISTIERNADIYHGSKDEEFDERIWARDGSKRNIRLILRDFN